MFLGRRELKFALGILVFCAGCGGPGKTRLPEHVIGHGGQTDGCFVKPRAVCTNSLDEIFVVDRSGRIQKFDSRGRFLLSWDLEKTDNGFPTGLCCDPAGELWVADTHNSRILHFSRDGTLLGQFGEYGEQEGRFVQPTDVLVDAEGNVYVTDYGGPKDRILHFLRDGTYMKEWGETGTGPGEFQRAMGLAFDPNGDLWVADACNHRLQCFHPDGTFVRAVGGFGYEPGKLAYPYDLDVDSKGCFYVCEFGNNRVQLLDSQGQTVSIWGKPGRGPGEFNSPWGVCLPRQTQLLVADADNHRLQVFRL